jgi:hypothetical protein
MKRMVRFRLPEEPHFGKKGAHNNKAKQLEAAAGVS